MLDGLIGELEQRLVSRPFGGADAVLIATADMDADEFEARYLSERSDEFIVSITGVNVETEHADSERDVMTATLDVVAAAPTRRASQWGTALMLHEHLRAVIREDPTLGGQAIEAGIGDAQLGAVFNSPRTTLETQILIRYEA